MTQETQRIRVRIAVAVDGRGIWCAIGDCADASSGAAIRTALDYLSRETSQSKHIVWVTAEVPLPAGQAGNVTGSTAAGETAVGGAVAGVVESATDSAE